VSTRKQPLLKPSHDTRKAVADILHGTRPSSLRSAAKGAKALRLLLDDLGDVHPDNAAYVEQALANLKSEAMRLMP
jgi:hypothetical protein